MFIRPVKKILCIVLDSLKVGEYGQCMMKLIYDTGISLNYGNGNAFAIGKYFIRLYKWIDYNNGKPRSILRFKNNVDGGFHMR